MLGATAAAGDPMDVYFHPDQQLHRPRRFLVRGEPAACPEVPERADALLEAVRGLGLVVRTPAAATREEAAAVHGSDYLDFLATAWAEWRRLPGASDEVVPNIHPTPEMAPASRPRGIVGRAGFHQADTACPIGEHTWRGALASAGSALAAARAVAGGAGAAYALCRPPGHHAYADRAGGFCFLNNAALAAEALRTAGAERATVLDVDVHHGNGTQGVFWTRGDVQTVSVHADPADYYPWFAGYAHERGAGPGEGTNLNLPRPLGTGDAGWLAALEDAAAAVRAFRPAALVVALGLDASEDDPLKGFRVTGDGFARAGALVAGLGLPTVLVQEGGYPSPALGANLRRFLEGFLGR